MAPEIHLGKPYTGEGVDIFAAAIILFIMVSQRPPFASADPKSDPHYKLLAAGRSDIFWEAHNVAQVGGYSPEFRDLFTNIMQLNPYHRLNLEEILKHPWLKNRDPCTKQEIQ